MRVSVLGMGSWGTALATLIRNNAETVMWGHNEDSLNEVKKNNENKKYLPGVLLDNISYEISLKKAFESKVIVLAIPSKGIRDFVELMKPYVLEDHIIVCCVKGFEMNGDQFQTMTDFLKDKLNKGNFACLSGPTHAEEVGAKKISAATLGYEKDEVGVLLQKIFMTSYFRVYTNQDMKGIEIGGAYKNIIAIAGGVLHQLKSGENAIAMLITRGLIEMRRLVKHEGAKEDTVLGLSGVGDMITTVFSPFSRNRYVGQELAKGKRLQEILDGMEQVSEGVRITKIIYEYSCKHHLSLPIAEAVYNILFNEKNIVIADIISNLMTRPPKSE